MKNVIYQSDSNNKPSIPPTAPYDPLEPEQDPLSRPLPPDANPQPSKPVREPEEPEPIREPQPPGPTRLM